MDLQDVRHFVAVAEELHFRRAAQRLGTSQPLLSRAVQRLEADLGARLIDRDNRNVSLTPAGAALLEDGKRLLAQHDAVTRRIQGIANNEQGRLRIGFVPWSVMRTLPRALMEFRQRWPGVEVRVDEQMSRSQVEALKDGTLDLGVLNRYLVDTAGLETATVETTRLVAAVPSAWPLARRRQVKLKELAGFTLILFPQHWVPDYYGAFEVACRRAGFTPKIGQYVGQPYTMFNLVANGFGIGLVQDSARHFKVEGVTLVPIADLDAQFWSEIALAWVPARLTPPLKAFIDTMLRVA